ncbi:MAG: acyl-CoA/acyl-ACP dehydrogenase [Alphaproteobacteria bacterium]|nr:acyl-CoA/acyl-ACP dehydrogenase [Alphaproteobacteria bacterium]
MSETRAILEDTCAKLFARFEEPAVLRRVEETGDCAEVWAAVAEQGLDQIFSGGSDDPWRDACVVLKACGRHVLPAPLAETLMAGAVLGEAAPEGPLTLAAPAQSELTVGHDGNLTGRLDRVAWGGAARHVVAEAVGRAVVLPVSSARLHTDRTISREPRDTLLFIDAKPVGSAPRDGQPTAIGALMRAAQMAGCIEAVLAMTVQYARDRQQFGKPIGSFQAIQHQLAILGGHAAAASRVVDAAFDRIAATNASPEVLLNEAAFTKIRCGEAAGVAASIAHQTHGAIGFTDEHRLHYFTRRLWSWRSEFGSEAHWSAILGRQVAATGADAYWPMVTAAG